MRIKTLSKGGTGLLPIILLLHACSIASSIPPEEIREGVPYTLASTYQVDPAAIELVRWEKVTFGDSCLDIPMRGPCQEAEVPGYRLFIDINGENYEYRSPENDPLGLLLAAAPVENKSDPVLVWEQQDLRCLSLRIYKDLQAAFGYCDGPQAFRPLLNPRARASEWAAFYNRFSSFDLGGEGFMLTFRGIGNEEPSEAWKRAIVAWARLVRPEIESGRSGASIGTAFVWQRTIPEKPGYCDFLTVEEYGRAFASRARCEGGDAVNLGEGWLQTDEMQAFDDWYYDYRVLEQKREEEIMRFFGRGNKLLPEADTDAMARWSEAIFNRIGR